MTFGITGNLEKPEVVEVLHTLLAQLSDARVPCVLDDRFAKLVRRPKAGRGALVCRTLPQDKVPAAADVLLTLGGDGTILRVARLVGRHQTPILGINLGKLGFLAEVSVGEMTDCVREVIAGAYTVEDRMMLRATAKGTRRNYSALNDIVVEKHGTSRMVNFVTFVNHEYVATYAADGIIFSSPTGSTAYSLANGGPILHPTNRVIAISPICPHTLTARPIIVTDDSKITVRIEEAPNRIRITADGQMEELLRPPVEVTIQRAPFVARLVKRLNTSYYDVLRKKLNWGSDIRLRARESR